MPQKPLKPELVKQAREMRGRGDSLGSIAGELGISAGSASNACRGIPKPLAEKASKRNDDGGGPVQAGRYDADETVRLANDLRKAELRESLERIESRRGEREALEQLRSRERGLQSELDNARLSVSKGDNSVLSEITQLRGELSELRESRFQSELKAAEDRHAQVIARLEQQISASGRTGLTEFDLMSQAMGKAENLAIMVADKVDRLVKSGQGDKHFMLGLQLGLTPSEFQHLQQGADEIPTREEWELGRRYRAHRDGVKLEEPDEGEYEGLVNLIEQRNRRWQNVMDRASRAMGRGDSQVVLTGKTPGQVPATGKPGQAPAPGEPEPVVLRAESKLVKCQRCGSTFDVDLNEARQHAAQGKKLFVNCPKCGFLLEITAEMIPELKPVEVLSTKPACFVAGQDGHCNSEMRAPEQCINCQWFGNAVRPMVFE